LNPPRPPIPDFLGALTDRDRDLRRIGLMALLSPLAAAVTAFVAIGLTTAGSGPLMPWEYDGPAVVRSGAFVIVLGISLAAMAVGFISVAALVFKRPFRSFVTAARRFRWGLLLWGLAISLWGLAVIAFADAQIRGGELTPPILDAQVPWALRLEYVAAITLGFLVAATAEELVFRGYLLQQLAAFSHRIGLAVFGSSVAFALIHLEFDAAAMAARVLTGVAFCWAALRLGGLEFAIGAHLANNLLLGLINTPLLPDAEPFQGELIDVLLEAALALWIIGAAEVTRRLRWWGGTEPGS
jgi:uncharacterized protein